MAKTKFPKRELGILLSWAILIFWFLSWGSTTAVTSAKPAFIVSLKANPKLIGPDNLCIVFGGIIGTYSAGGDPSTDVYTWLITGPSGEEILSRSGGAQFETMQVAFNAIGNYRVELSIRRNNDIILTETKVVSVKQGPELTFLPDYLICGNSPTEITAINPNTPNIGQYIFNWTDVSGNLIGNTNTIAVSQEGYYKIELYFAGSSGQQDCLITGSTFVGPSLDFDLNLSATSFCQGRDLIANVDRPISGEWFLIPPNSSTRTSIGNAFEVKLEPSSIADPGVYTLVFSATDPNYPDCKSERKATFEVLESPKFKVTLVEKVDNCEAKNGAFDVLSLNSLDSIFIPELGYSAYNTTQNQNFSFNNLDPQIYSIVAYNQGCKFVTLYDLESKNPPLITGTTPDIIPPTITIEPEACSNIGVVPGSVQLVFSQGEVTGEYRILGKNLGELIASNFKSQDTLSISLPGGTYLFELKIGGCTYPVKEFEVPTKPFVEFSTPNQIVICESFELIPETSQDLLFTLKYPDMTEVTLKAGQPFTLTESGDYELFGESVDPTSGPCPRLAKFSATLTEVFSFNPSLYSEDCFGNQVYRAELDGVEPETVSIRWIDAKGEIVGRNELFYATAAGDFSLLVQPLKSGECPVQPVNFTVEAPVLQVEVLLEAAKICPDPGTTFIELTSDLARVKTINWIFFDDAGNRRDLTEFDNLLGITVDMPGSYEAVVYNRIGCEIGRNLILIETSSLLELPKVDEEYGICAKGRIGPTISPGNYAEYFWYLDEKLVATSAQFAPKEIGDYTLRVTTEDGCEFSTPFEVVDGCRFEYIFPNAMVLGDPARNFEVRVSEGVTEAELFIINRQGALIHYQKTTEIPIGEAFFEWDGTSNGTNITSDTYVVIFIGRNPKYQFEEKITRSLLVL